MPDLHDCQAIGCPLQAPPHEAFCRDHWERLPRPHRRALVHLRSCLGRQVQDGPWPPLRQRVDLAVALAAAVNYLALQEGWITQDQADRMLARARREAWLPSTRHTRRAQPCPHS